tara:strand:+ start:110681 stop:112498 length:1818 start_codon:yes stop_codon:yes gene_type:complete
VDLFKKFFISYIILGAASLQAASLFSSLDQRQIREWENLLHFQNGVSENDGELFFLSSQGKVSLEKEFEASLKVFQENKAMGFGRFNSSAACAFQSRYFWFLKNKFISPISFKCDAYEKWKKEINPHKVSIVFSTAYPNNPASMFGHTFLKFHHKDEKNELLDYASGFEARVDSNDWAPVYAWKGLFGGYPGLYDLKKFYQKVAEYNHGENRDLYTYHLNLSQKQVDLLLMHLWELYNTSYFDYYFTWENCSYQLGRLLDVVLEKNLDLPSPWYYLPSDLVIAISNHQGLVEKVSYRPSQEKEFKKHLNLLSGKEVLLLKESFKTQELPKQQSKEILDTLIKWNQMDEYKKKGKLSKSDKKFKRAVLVARSQLGAGKNYNFKYQQSNNPQQAHKQRRLTTEYKNIEGFHLYQLKIRSGYTDLLSSDKGLEKFSEFRFGELGLSYDEESLKIGDWTVASVTSIHPLTFYNKQISWSIGLEGRRGIHSITHFHADAGVGLGEETSRFGFFVGLDTEYSARKSVLKKNISPAPRGRILSLFQLGEKIKLKFDLIGKYQFLEVDKFQYHLNSEGSFLMSKNFDLRLGSKFYSFKDEENLELKLSLGVYY